MSKRNNHIESLKELSSEMMKAYLNGELSAKQQHQVERFLLDHPFEAEAMEGFSENKPAFEDMPALYNRLENRINQADEKIIIPLWRKALPYAAAIIFLILATFVTINFMNQQEDWAPIALNEKESIEFDDSLVEIVPPAVTQKQSEIEGIQKTEEVPMPARSIDKEDVIPTEVADVSRMEHHEAAEEIIADIVFEEAAGEKTISAVADSFESKNAMAKKMQSSLQNTDEIAAIIIEEKENSSRKILGQVIDADTGEPIPGVNILVKNTNRGTNTDLEGNFEIEAQTDEVIIANFIGMQKQEVTVGNYQTIEIEMQADVAQLSEVVVTGYGTEEVVDNSYHGPQPEGGFSEFKKYLVHNLVYPEAAKNKKVEGRVRLKLTISESGTISNIEILKSLSDACDQEAIRLVKQGPKWKPAKKGVETLESTVKVMVKFELK